MVNISMGFFSFPEESNLGVGDFLEKNSKVLRD